MMKRIKSAFPSKIPTECALAAVVFLQYFLN